MDCDAPGDHPMVAVDGLDIGVQISDLVEAESLSDRHPG
jgi:hypothetical protein